MTLKSEINFAGLVKAQIEYTRKKAKDGTAGGNRSNLAGGLHSVIVLTEWECDDNGNYVPIAVKAEIVDGVRIKADTWYKLENGEFVEADI